MALPRVERAGRKPAIVSAGRSWVIGPVLTTGGPRASCVRSCGPATRAARDGADVDAPGDARENAVRAPAPLPEAAPARAASGLSSQPSTKPARGRLLGSKG